MKYHNHNNITKHHKIKIYHRQWLIPHLIAEFSCTVKKKKSFPFSFHVSCVHQPQMSRQFPKNLTLLMSFRNKKVQNKEQKSQSKDQWPGTPFELSIHKHIYGVGKFKCSLSCNHNIIRISPDTFFFSQLKAQCLTGSHSPAWCKGTNNYNAEQIKTEHYGLRMISCIS